MVGGTVSSRRILACVVAKPLFSIWAGPNLELWVWDTTSPLLGPRFFESKLGFLKWVYGLLREA